MYCRVDVLPYFCADIILSPMKIITFANNKGGVGKTTSALAVAQRLAEQGHKVLLIDADPQCNATITFGFDNSMRQLHGLDEALREHKPLPLSELMQIGSVTSELWVVPSTRLVAQAEKAFGQQMDYLTFFRRWITPAFHEEFDFTVIDTAPNLGPLTVAALVASDAVFVPMQPNFFGSEGMSALLDMVQRVHDNYNPKLKVGGIFFTKYSYAYRRSLHNQYATAIKDDPSLANLVMGPTIRENVSLDEAHSMRQSIFEWAPESNGAKDYRVLTDEILERIK
jgi:chromosome partitioning protein